MIPSIRLHYIRIHEDWMLKSAIAEGSQPRLRVRKEDPKGSFEILLCLSSGCLQVLSQLDNFLM